MKFHDEFAQKGAIEMMGAKKYGFRSLRPLFFSGEQPEAGDYLSLLFVQNMINFSKLFQIFNRDLQRVVIFYDSPFQKDVHLNDMFLEQILCGILEINENVALKSVFKEILMVNPLIQLIISLMRIKDCLRAMDGN